MACSNSSKKWSENFSIIYKKNQHGTDILLLNLTVHSLPGFLQSLAHPTHVRQLQHPWFLDWIGMEIEWSVHWLMEMSVYNAITNQK